MVLRSARSSEVDHRSRKTVIGSRRPTLLRPSGVGQGAGVITSVRDDCRVGVLSSWGPRRAPVEQIGGVEVRVTMAFALRALWWQA